MDNKEHVTQDLSQWIETRVIAELVVSHLEDTGEEVSFENGKQVWLEPLQLLGGPLAVS